MQPLRPSRVNERGLGNSAGREEIDIQLAQLQAEYEKSERELEIADFEEQWTNIRKQAFRLVPLLDEFNTLLGSIPTPAKPRGTIFHPATRDLPETWLTSFENWISCGG